MAEKTPYQALNPINNLIDEFSPDGGICVAYTTDGCSESVSLELDTLYCNQVDSLYDEDDQPIDPEVFLAQKMVDLISKLEQVKAALLKKYPARAAWSIRSFCRRSGPSRPRCQAPKRSSSRSWRRGFERS